MRRLTEYELIVGFFLILFLTFMISGIVDSVNETNTARTCIAAGGSWTESKGGKPAACDLP